jgi:CubicO group peptidase (beta-lactamase class C family)
MLIIKKINLALIVVFSTVGLASSQKKIAYEPRTAEKKTEAYLDRMADAGFSGVILVEINGKPAILKAYGYSNEQAGFKNGPRTLFDIGSITKQFTAAAILRLEMDGKLSTEDKLSKYFDGVPADKAEITLHDLLRHQSGLPSTVGADYDQITQADFVKKVFDAPLKFSVGERFSYSNIGYSLLAMIVEKVSGQSYEDYLQANLFKPAGMDTTGYSRPSFDLKQIAVGYRMNGEAWGKPTDKAWDGAAPYWHLKGNGGILSTVGDLYKWHRALLSDKILSKAAKQKLYSPKRRPNEDDNPYYAYGWDVMRTSRATLLARHNGTNRIFFSDFFRFLDEGVAIIQLSNKANPAFGRLNLSIARIIFEPTFVPVVPAKETSDNIKFTDQIVKTIEEKGFDQGLSALKGRKTHLELIEHIVADKAYELLDAEKPTVAVDLFRINTVAYPASNLAFEGLGEAYLAAKNNALAIKALESSLSLYGENSYAKRLLEQAQELSK